MTLGEAIRRIRKKRELTQQDLATESGLSLSYINQIENGTDNTMPADKAIRKIATALNFPAEALAFLSLNKSDVDPDKIEAFEMVKMPIDAMIEKFFLQ